MGYRLRNSRPSSDPIRAIILGYHQRNKSKSGGVIQRLGPRVTRTSRQFGTTIGSGRGLRAGRARRGQERLGKSSQGVGCPMRVFLAGLVCRGRRWRRRNGRCEVCSTAIAAGRGDVGGETRKVRHGEGKYISSPVETNAGWNSTQGRLELHRWAGKGPTMSS